MVFFVFITNTDFYEVDVSIKETFSPLAKVDMKFHNSILAKMEIKKTRTIALDIGANQVAENNTYSYELLVKIEELSATRQELFWLRFLLWCYPDLLCMCSLFLYRVLLVAL